MTQPEEDPVRFGFLGRLSRTLYGPRFPSILMRPSPFRIGRVVPGHRQAAARTLRTTATIAIVLVLGLVGLRILDGSARLAVPAFWFFFYLGYARFQGRLQPGRRPLARRRSPEEYSRAKERSR